MDTTYEASEDIVITDEDAKSEQVQSVEDTRDDIPESASNVEQDEDEGVDYESLIESDLAALKAEFPELKDIGGITELNNPLRYAALRDLGLSPIEAYMATAKRRTQDTRSHLKSAHGRSAAAPTGMMSQYELASARELFPGMSDADLQRLYKKVTK